MSRPKHAGKASGDAQTDLQKRDAAVYGRWAGDSAMKLACSLERLAQMEQDRAKCGLLPKGRGRQVVSPGRPFARPAITREFSQDDFERLLEQTQAKCIAWLFAAIRYDKRAHKVVYDRRHIDRLADAIAALNDIRAGASVKRFHRDVLDYLHASNRMTAAELAQRIGTTPDEARRIAKEVGRDAFLLPDKRGRPAGSKNLPH